MIIFRYLSMISIGLGIGMSIGDLIRGIQIIDGALLIIIGLIIQIICMLRIKQVEY